MVELDETDYAATLLIEHGPTSWTELEKASAVLSAELWRVLEDLCWPIIDWLSARLR